MLIYLITNIQFSLSKLLTVIIPNQILNKYRINIWHVYFHYIMIYLLSHSIAENLILIRQTMLSSYNSSSAVLLCSFSYKLYINAILMYLFLNIIVFIVTYLET